MMDTASYSIDLKLQKRLTTVTFGVVESHLPLTLKTRRLPGETSLELSQFTDIIDPWHPGTEKSTYVTSLVQGRAWVLTEP